MNESNANKELGNIIGTANCVGDAAAAQAPLGAGRAIGGDRTQTISMRLEVSADRHFTDALYCCIHGQRITRVGWNGPDQYVTAQYPDKQSKMTAPYLVLKNSRNEFVPWVPSQGDLFAHDWAVLPIQPI